ncbi:MAG: hypothetical protein HMLKMBBP_03045 [Planctomycetes bacterium]|nr:hypothetical protein [Planctomycetota bacterium]
MHPVAQRVLTCGVVALLLPIAHASLSTSPLDPEEAMELLFDTASTALCGAFVTGGVVAAKDVRVSTDDAGFLSVFVRAKSHHLPPKAPSSSWTLRNPESAFGDVAVEWNMTAPPGAEWGPGVGTFSASVLFDGEDEPDGLRADAEFLGPDGAFVRVSLFLDGAPLLGDPVDVATSDLDGMRSADLRLVTSGDDVVLESADPNAAPKVWTERGRAAGALAPFDGQSRHVAGRVELGPAGAELRTTGIFLSGFVHGGTGKQIAVSGSAGRSAISALGEPDAAGAEKHLVEAADQAGDVAGFIEFLTEETLAELGTTPKKLVKPLLKAQKHFTKGSALYGLGNDAGGDARARKGLIQTIRALSLLRGMKASRTRPFTRLVRGFAPEV